jgi:hypothetical protein
MKGGFLKKISVSVKRKAVSWLSAFVMVIALPGVSLGASAESYRQERLILMWQVQRGVTEDDLAFFSRKGITLIQSYGIVNWRDEDVKAYFEKALKYNIRAVVTMGKMLSKKEGKLTFDRERAKQFLTRWKNHPGVYAWHPFDEPCNPEIAVPSSFQNEVYAFLKSLDEKHPIMISWNGTSDKQYKPYFAENAFDILDLHAYVRDVPGVRQQNLLEAFTRHRKREYPVILTLRAFNSPGKEWPALSKDGLKKQYDFFFGKSSLTRNIGFYGWDLPKNLGISNDPDIMRQFKELNF